ncbi:MAG: hypothetical protein WA006_07535 [Rhodoglobus sp.]
MPSSRTRVALGATITALALAALAGCVQGAPMPTPTATPTPSVSPTSVTNDLNPVLRPGQSAAANRQFFDATNAALQAAAGKSDGQTIVDTLAAAGFIKADMEVTYDSTALGIPADSIIVSVRIGDECLIGQFAPSYYRGDLQPVLGTGRCLVGLQRPIDW